jgi:hypothetical protein
LYRTVNEQIIQCLLCTLQCPAQTLNQQVAGRPQSLLTYAYCCATLTGVFLDLGEPECATLNAVCACLYAGSLLTARPTPCPRTTCHHGPSLWPALSQAHTELEARDRQIYLRAQLPAKGPGFTRARPAWSHKRGARAQLVLAGVVPRPAAAAAAVGVAAAAAVVPARACSALAAAGGAGRRAWAAWNSALALVGAGLLGQARRPPQPLARVRPQELSEARACAMRPTSAAGAHPGAVQLAAPARRAAQARRATQGPTQGGDAALLRRRRVRRRARRRPRRPRPRWPARR